MTWSPDEPLFSHSDPRRHLAGYLDGLTAGVSGHAPVPVSIWRLAAAGAAAAAPAGGLTAWLAHRLVATFTRRGGTVVDFDADPALRHAAAAASSCGYLPVTTAGDLARLEASGDVDLITLRWPRPEPVAELALTDLFRACRLVLGRRGHTAVIIDPPTNGPHLEHGRDLVHAATTAGMDYLQRIIAVLSSDEADTPVAPVPAGEGPRASADEVHIRVQVEMLIFVLGGPGAR
jgi:hypothetical protein